MRLHAGHGLNYRNVGPVAAIPLMAELNIGHAIVSRAVFVGLREAVREMKDCSTSPPWPATSRAAPVGRPAAARTPTASRR